MVDILQLALPVAPETPVLYGSGRTWTRARLRQAVDERVRALRGEVYPGRIRPLTVDPDLDGVVELLAVWRVGAVPAPLSPRLTATERSRAVLALSGAEGAAALPGRAAAVLWTSGTSGQPRGVVLSARNLLAMTTAIRQRLRLGIGDTWLASLSPAHVGGLALMVRALLLGSGLVAPGRSSLDGLLDGLRGTAGAPPVSHLSLVPTQFLRLLDAWPGAGPPKSLRCVILGGAATPPDLLHRGLDAGWPISLTYGMTEMTSQVATTTPAETRKHPGSVGRPLRSAQVRIAEDGEILVRGTARALAYLADDLGLGDADGWYHTGDLGRLDDDGRLWIEGRKSDRIISGGVTVDPHEVEHTLAQHPAVREVCVVGVPDPEWGERVAAVIVPAGSGLDQSRMEDWAYERLGAARLPRIWRVVTQLPENRNGKVDRSRVLALLEDDESL